MKPTRDTAVVSETMTPTSSKKAGPGHSGVANTAKEDPYLDLLLASPRFTSHGELITGERA